MNINNPVYTMKIIDLLDMFNDNFNYDDIYNVVDKWLSTEKKYFFTNDTNFWKEFIQAFCDRFYSRNLNFDTTLDFKLKLRDVLRSSKNRAERIFESNAIKINPLNTYSNSMTRNENYKGNSSNKTINENSTNNNNNTHATNNSEDISNGSVEDTTKSSSFNYNLHSDTPSNAVNIDDLFSVAKNYVTDAQNTKSNGSGSSTQKNQNTNTNKNVSDVESDSRTVSTGSSNGSNSYENENLFKEVSTGYNGNPTDLIEKYMQLKTDVIQFYLDEIENACLFSCVLY